MTKESFKELFDTYFDSVRNYIFYRSGDTELATDIAQETFMKIWEKKFENIGKIKALLFKIAGDLFINQYRKQQTSIKFKRSIEMNEDEYTPEEELEYNELKRKYEKALSSLPEKQRMVFLMSRYDGLKYQEISERLKISVKTVEKRMSKTLSYMREHLKQA